MIRNPDSTRIQTFFADGIVSLVLLFGTIGAPILTVDVNIWLGVSCFLLGAILTYYAFGVEAKVYWTGLGWEDSLDLYVKRIETSTWRRPHRLADQHRSFVTLVANYSRGPEVIRLYERAVWESTRTLNKALTALQDETLTAERRLEGYRHHELHTDALLDGAQRLYDTFAENAPAIQREHATTTLADIQTALDELEALTDAWQQIREIESSWPSEQPS